MGNAQNGAPAPMDPEEAQGRERLDRELNGNQEDGAAAAGRDRGVAAAPAGQGKNKKKVITIKNQSHIKKETIKIKKLSDSEPDKFTLDMQFDANFECVITVYICARECRNAANIPLYFYTDPDMPVPCAYKFSSGLKQKFPHNLFVIDTAKYNGGPMGNLGTRKDDLFHMKDDFYPIVISIETVYPEGYRGKGKKNIQFTYGSFQKDGSSNMRYKFLKQKLLYNNQIMDLNDIYGIDNNAANLADESQRECVVCYTNTKDTVVLPCRHMCLCIDCSQIVRMQTNKCPICRTTVSSFLHIKYDVKIPLNSTTAPAEGQAIVVADQAEKV